MSRLFRIILSVVSLGASSAVCLDGGASLLCIDWQTSGSNVTFNATCAPYQGAAVTWCAFAVSATKIAAMYPADVAVLQAGAAGGAAAATIEDRANIAFAVPLCMQTQLSSLLGGGVTPAGGVLKGTWTRPAAVTPALAAQGYLPLAGSMYMIAASATDQPATSAPCSNALAVHTYTQTAVAVTF